MRRLLALVFCLVLAGTAHAQQLGGGYQAGYTAPTLVVAAHGTSTWSPAAGTVSFDITMCGAGGSGASGGASTTTGQSASGGGGGGAGACIFVTGIPVAAISAPVTYVVGTGGTGPAGHSTAVDGTVGAAGTASTFGTYFAAGAGGGGGPGAGNNDTTHGGGGGASAIWGDTGAGGSGTKAIAASGAGAPVNNGGASGGTLLPPAAPLRLMELAQAAARQMRPRAIPTREALPLVGRPAEGVARA